MVPNVLFLWRAYMRLPLHIYINKLKVAVRLRGAGCLDWSQVGEYLDPACTASQHKATIKPSQVTSIFILELIAMAYMWVACRSRQVAGI